jgi:hypothetical protein
MDPLKSSAIKVNPSGSSQGGTWHDEAMRLDLPTPFKPGEYCSLTLRCHETGHFMVTAFVAHADHRLAVEVADQRAASRGLR